MNVKELVSLLSTYPEDTKIGVHSYDLYAGGEDLELADGVSEGFTYYEDEPVIYIY